MALPTIDDLRLHLNMTGTDHDDELVDMLDAAIEVAEGIVGTLDAGDVTEVHRVSYARSLILRRMPTGALVEVFARFAYDDSLPISLDDLELDTATGIVTAVSGANFHGDFVVTYSSGNSALPASVKLGILIIAAHLWETQRGTSPSALSLQQLDAEPGAGPVGAGYAIPNRARELLAAYVSPSLP